MANSKIRRRSKLDEILSSLWILVAFIPYLNGFGLIYIGNKTSKGNWIKEGMAYEIPWILSLIVYEVKPINYIFIVVGIIMMIVGIVRSIIANSKYQKILNNGNYKKSESKTRSLAGLIVTLIPCINGMTFLYLGGKMEDRKLLYEGTIYELPWILSIIFVFTPLGGAFFYIGMALQIVSLFRYIHINYTDSRFYKTLGNLNDNREENLKRDEPANAEYKEKAKMEKPKNNVRESAYVDYKPKIKELKENFDKKEEKVRNIVNNRFKSSELTHGRFMTIISNSHDNFYSQMETANNIIDLSGEKSPKIDGELQKKISILEMINGKMDELIMEMILNDSSERKTDEDLETMVNDMEDLINSVKNYN
ncbi:MAG: hypothetical protein Q4P18_01185 [Methanobrevibacter sp.]|uniref:hypothetical protein n=1 Tax=Methanobrevibacter sp. TaxID=66852 RepID=UPI0026E08E30|nr:hypothetical protein [Methanobrevibacter sp.]MDO5848128.1 hypothetical protein [Methanobrevibacter sp.]